MKHGGGMTKNKKILLTLAIFFFAGVLIHAGGPKRRAILDKKDAPKPYAEGEVLVKFKKGIDLAGVKKFAKTQSLNLKKRFKLLSKAKGQEIVLLKSSKKVDAEVLAKALSANPNVVYATPNYRRELAATPDDTNFNSLWGMHNTGQTGGTPDADIDAPEAWDHSTGSSDIVVAIIDSGIDYNHPDLKANVWKNSAEYWGIKGVDDDGNGYIDDIYGIDPAGADGSGTNPDTDPMDGFGHGSHCAGTISAVGNNSLGVAGVNWSVKLMGLKFFGDADGGGWEDDAIECMEYVIEQKQTYGQNIVAVNASWGSVDGSDSGAERDAIEVVNNAGIVFCAAVGNGGDDGVGDNNDQANGRNHHYPSDYTLPGIISVMATDDTDTRASFSNYGATSVDLAAPGVGILSTIPPLYIPKSGNIFFDNCSSEGNWVETPTNSTWAITTEIETYFGSPYPTAPSTPTFWSDSPGAGGAYGFYAVNTDSYLTYNADINLSGYDGQEIYFGMWIARHIERYDHLYLEISADSGLNWTVLNDWPTTYDPVDDATYIWFWANYYKAIPEDFKTANFRMRFHFVSDESLNGLGVVIDDIGIGQLNTYYDSWDGTSMATPHVTGAVALMASVFQSETVSQRKIRILNYADVKASLSGLCVTAARLNLHNSIEAPAPTADPKIFVTSPNGGESWMVGIARDITWISEGTVTNVEIYYSTNNGTNWTLIDGDEVNDGSYTWNPIPNTPSVNCLVRVREIDDSPTDQSDAVFSIVASGTETVSTPTTPTGPATGYINTSYTYWTDASATNTGDPVQYYFDWGDGNNSGWLAVGTRSAAHSWTTTGTKNVQAMARCSIHTAIQSAWSTTLPVTLGDGPTWVAVSGFGACAAESQPTVEWRTASEFAPIGFNLWRQNRESREFELVNPGLLSSLLNSPQGGVYRFADPGAFPGEPVVYRLEEIDSLGRTMSYGPFTVTFGSSTNISSEPEVKAGSEEPSEIYGYQRFPRERSLYEQERLNARRQEQQKGAALAASQGNERVRVTVKGRGLFYVTVAQIVTSLGMSETGAAALISGYNLSLTGMGKEIAWLADANGAGIFFYNEGKETIYSDKNIYFLEKGRGLAMETVSGGSAGAADPNQSFLDTLHFEGNRYALLIPSMDPAGDLWFWEYVVAGSAVKSFPIQVPGVTGAGKAMLTVSLQGGSDTPAVQDHHAIISLNGSQIGDAVWDGTKAYTVEIAFNPSLLQDGANTIIVSGALDVGAPYSTFYVEAFDLSYQRYYKAVDNSLICRGDDNPTITVSGLTELQAVVLDVTTPDWPRQLTGVAPDVSGRVTFVSRSANNTYLVSSPNASLRPFSVVGDRPANLKGPSHSAEYIVIAPEEFREAAQELADFHKSKGLKSQVVALEDIYDAFNYGVPSPYAIRDFLAHAYAKWSGKKVRYAVLAGKGTYDYNDYKGYGDNLVPAILGRTPEGLCAADRIFGDVKGKDGLPEIAIGRLPAVTNAELQAMIGKIKAYESGQGAWTDKGVFIADNADSDGDFAQGSNELAAMATGLQAEKIYLNGSAQETHGRIVASWNAGAALVNYCGHAGINQLAAENIFNVSDAGSLQNGSQLPLVTMLTCVAGRFELPGFTSLGEALVLNANGGMAGGLLPSGAAMNSNSLRLAEEFYKAVFRGKEESAGAALLAAMKRYLQQGGTASLLNVYNWLGDPAAEFK